MPFYLRHRGLQLEYARVRQTAGRSVGRPQRDSPHPLC
ncbi:hypothetical protein C7S15_3791 [Burkholderia cepacia]|nr:hypothetical protein [Burkholderia cepacia]